LPCPRSPAFMINPPQSHSCFACLYRPSLPESQAPTSSLVSIAQEFSPRYEQYGDALIVIDVRGLERLLGSPRAIAHELRRESADRGVLVHVALASTQTAAIVLALARPGMTVIEPDHEASALATLPLHILEKPLAVLQPDAHALHPVLQAWGLKTFGELAALPAADLAARLGQQGLICQAIARGEDLRPLVPTLAEERFESSQELDWPIAELEPLSFVLTRLLEPLVTRLERRDRGVAVLHVRLHLVTRDVHARQLELSVPLRDVRTLRALALIDLESHPPPASIDIVTVVIDPTPGRVLQHTLFTRPHPTPEQLSTLLARLAALVGQDRIGAPALVDSYRPGAFEMKPFAIDREIQPQSSQRSRSLQKSLQPKDSANSANSAANLTTALRRCRQPVPARVAVGADGRPVRVTTDRRGFAGGGVTACVGPWRTSGEWWEKGWNRDEWDVALNDGAVYRIFRDRSTDGWFIEAIVD
jgi:protein ImuB